VYWSSTTAARVVDRVGAARNDAKFLTNVDHQLIIHILNGLRQFHHLQNKGEESRGKSWQKTAIVATWLEDPYTSTKQQLFTKTNRAATACPKKSSSSYHHLNCSAKLVV
jgi:hypothetical protein